VSVTSGVIHGWPLKRGPGKARVVPALIGEGTGLITYDRRASGIHKPWNGDYESTRSTRYMDRLLTKLD